MTPFVIQVLSIYLFEPWLTIYDSTNMARKSSELKVYYVIVISVHSVDSSKFQETQLFHPFSVNIVAPGLP